MEKTEKTKKIDKKKGTTKTKLLKFFKLNYDKLI